MTNNTNEQPKSSHASSTPVTVVKLKEKEKEYIQRSQWLYNDRPPDDPEVQTPSPPSPPPPHSSCPSQSTLNQALPTLPQTNIDGLSYCFLSDNTKSALDNAASSEGLRFQLGVHDCGLDSQATLDDVNACRTMAELAIYFNNPRTKSTEAMECFQDFLGALRRVFAPPTS